MLLGKADVGTFATALGSLGSDLSQSEDHESRRVAIESVVPLER